MKIDMEKAAAELRILRTFVDFVNSQIGVYCDCLAGFQGNKVRIERQVARVQRPVSRRIKDGQPVIVWASVEDPTSPDVLHHRIIRADEFVAANSEAGFNEQQLCWSIIVFLYAYWEEEIRPQIAEVRGVKSRDIKIHALGDLRILRKNIIHNGGVLPNNEYAKLKVMNDICLPNAKMTFTHDQMHKVFVHVKRAIGELILEYSGHLPGAPNPAQIVGIAISNGHGSK